MKTWLALIGCCLGAWLGEAATPPWLLGRWESVSSEQLDTNAFQIFRADFEGGDVIHIKATSPVWSSDARMKYKVLDQTATEATIQYLDGPRAQVMAVIKRTPEGRLVFSENARPDSALTLQRMQDPAVFDQPLPQAERIQTVVPMDEKEHAQMLQNVVLSPPAPATRFVVMIPEQVNTIWYWYFFTESRQLIVQSMVEQALLHAGYEVIDLSLAQLPEGVTMDRILSPGQAVDVARQLGATYAIIGQATAAATERQVIAGRTDFAGSAQASARIVQTADGKLLQVIRGSSTSSETAQREGGGGALEEAGQHLVANLMSALNLITLP